VNDRAHEDDIELQLNKKENVHDAATSGTSESTDPDPEGRSLLRRYARAGFCPESLKRSEIPNFYQTCLKLAGKSVTTDFVKGYHTDSAKVRRAIQNTTRDRFKLRMEQIKQANNPLTRKENTLNRRDPPKSPLEGSQAE